MTAFNMAMMDLYIIMLIQFVIQTMEMLNMVGNIQQCMLQEELHRLTQHKRSLLE